MSTKPARALPPVNFANRKAAIEGHSICMGVSGGDPGGHVTSGTHIIVWDCNASNDQVWSITGFAPNFVFQNAATNASGGGSMCLTDPGGSADKGAQVIIAPCTGGFGQQFQMMGDPGGSGCYLFKNVGSGRVVGVANASANPVKDGMSVIMWDANGSADQLWCPQSPPVIPIG
jgi:hypothetical protein